MLASLQTAQGQVVQAVIRDVTERRQAEKKLGEALQHEQADLALRASEARYRTLFDVSRDGIVIADLETKVIRHANPAASRMLGYSEEEFVALGVADIHPKEALPRVVAEFEDPARPLAVDIPCLKKDGTIIYADINIATITVDGRASRVGFFRDVTERKRAQGALLEREYLLSESQRIAHIGTWSMNLVTGVMRRSDEAYRIYGVDPGTLDLTTEAFTRLIHPDDRQAMQDWTRACIAGERPGVLDFRIVRPDGEHSGTPGTRRADAGDRPQAAQNHWHGSGRHRAQAGGGGAEPSSKSSSARRRRWRRSGPRRAASRTTSTTSCRSSSATADVGDDSMPLRNPIRADLERSTPRDTRAAMLTRQLLAFGRQQMLQPRPSNLNDIVRPHREDAAPV